MGRFTYQSSRERRTRHERDLMTASAFGSRASSLNEILKLSHIYAPFVLSFFRRVVV